MSVELLVDVELVGRGMLGLGDVGSLGCRHCRGMLGTRVSSSATERKNTVIH